MTAQAVTASAISGGLAFLTDDITVAVFGVPFPYLFAGFAGAVLALAFLPQMTRFQAFIAVVAGTLVAAWGVLPASEQLGFKPGPGYAFVLGLVAHALLTLLFKKGPDWLDGILRKGTS